MSNTFTILIVEDDPDDLLLIRRALASVKLQHNLVAVEDGKTALAYLQKGGLYENVARPDLIFLDLNIPKIDGWAILEEVKTDPVLHSIPIVILTNSQNDKEISKAYNLHSNGFIVKPANSEKFMEVIQKTIHFWLTVVLLPNHYHRDY